MKILCVFGQYQYGDRSRGLSTEYRTFVPALERNGHQVVFFDSWERGTYADLSELNRALLQTVERERPDLMLLVPMTAEVWLETIEIIKARGVIMVCWTTDDSWKYEQQSKYIAKAFDLITTTYPHIVERYHRDGIPHVLLTQWAAASADLHEPVPAAECRYGVTFVGAMHGNRKKRADELAATGIKIDCFGYGWPRGAVSAEEMLEIFRQSRITLNFANSQGENQIKARVFEVPGAGGFLLTESARGLERYYDVGTEIDTFDDVESLAAKIRHYLANPELRDAMCRRAHERTRREHTYEARMREIVDTAVRMRQPATTAPSIDEACARYRIGGLHRALRTLLVSAGTLLFGRRRGRRAARRLVYELSWRFAGQKTYTAAGLPGRLFPKD